jgi:DNA-binding YbaB/EbfC family protein
MGSGFAKKKKQMRSMQEQMMKMQEDMKVLEVEGSAGNGLVTVKLNGDNKMVGLKIKPECVDPDDIEGLEDLIKAAHDDAQKKLQEKLPGLDNLGGMGGMGGAMGGGMPDMNEIQSLMSKLGGGGAGGFGF